MSLAAYALVDCNNFYCSCERVFRPDLRDKPIVVLSNNDGCIISRSNEAKALGVQMGAPYFKQKPFLKRNNVTVFSSNYPLYGDLSDRVMKILRTFCPDMEVYSIDEAFLRLDGFSTYNLTEYAQHIRNTVYQWTGIPVSIGIAPTKTLAKIASHICKKTPKSSGVYNMNDKWAQPAQIDALLENVPVSEIWGIGRKSAAKLYRYGVTTARQLRDRDNAWLQKMLTVTGLYTALELRGVSSIALDEAPAARRSIRSSRSFGKPVTEKTHAQEAAVAYTVRAAEKLRREGLLATTISVFIKTSVHRPGDQHAEYCTHTFDKPTDFTPLFVHHASEMLQKIFRAGHQYQKVGVLLSGLELKRNQQGSLLEVVSTESQRQTESEARLMHVTDAINKKFGRGTVQYAGEGLGQPWKMKQENLSPKYTTDWSKLPEIY
ncbi:Y-family DNA polymerase [Halodesulfovibrio marinisediminis]|uniref:DNA polymerase V n=1 Tax=Halodesulfovibrio marinisediminis DSM 17456 TaxID=1121457 RepID=A0A1N6H206_9BACT|nr:Y-family DNA polymerase [Halodesulfovibrio marinisediminis]SIO13786.1 DNA polymerase V [Halodesulfovibrio marinisediminis DSM 17456]